jgi:hypothetical protein
MLDLGTSTEPATVDQQVATLDIFILFGCPDHLLKKELVFQLAHFRLLVELISTDIPELLFIILLNTLPLALLLWLQADLITLHLERQCLLV